MKFEITYYFNGRFENVVTCESVQFAIEDIEQSEKYYVSRAGGNILDTDYKYNVFLIDSDGFHLDVTDAFEDLKLHRILGF